VLEPLGSHGSCHSKRADALSATTEQFLLLPVDHAIVEVLFKPPTFGFMTFFEGFRIG